MEGGVHASPFSIREVNHMSFDQLWDIFGIPVLILLVCLYYYYRVAVNHDIDAIRGKYKRPLKPEAKELYAKEAGKLLLLFAAGAVGMALLSLVSPYAALAEVIAVTAVEVVLWRRLNQRFER